MKKEKQIISDKDYYIRECNAIKQEYEAIRSAAEARIRPIIEQKALSLKVDLINTQHSLSIDRNAEENDAFNEFKEFIYRLSDDFKIAPCFEVHKRKFYWL